MLPTLALDAIHLMSLLFGLVGGICGVAAFVLVRISNRRRTEETRQLALEVKRLERGFADYTRIQLSRPMPPPTISPARIPDPQVSPTKPDPLQPIPSQTPHASPEIAAQGQVALPTSNVPPQMTKSLARSELLSLSQREMNSPYIEVGSLSFMKSTGGSSLTAAAKTIVFSDVKQVASFVRISLPGDDVAYVFPDPRAKYQPHVTQVFPTVTASTEWSQQSLDTLEPLLVTRIVGTPGQWEGKWPNS